MNDKAGKSTYTCNEYRLEMILLSLEQRLNRPGLEAAEKRAIEAEVKRVRAEMDME